MKFIRISNLNVINLARVERFELIDSEDVVYITIHFSGGGSYRCTEEESQTIVKILQQLMAPAATA